jgi:nucleoside-diphosphate-sugar epimerase
LTVFLSGARGYVAGAFQRVAAARADLKVSPIDRFTMPDLASHAIKGRAAILHLAWPPMPATTASADEADEVWRAYRDWTVRLGVAAERERVPFVGVGSGLELYAGDDRLSEPYRSYAIKKASLKADLAAVGASWVRLHFMFGREERLTRVVPAAILACLGGETLTCGALKRRRRWLHVDDQAVYLADFVRQPEQGEWDVAGREDVSFRDMLSFVERATGRPLRVAESKDRTPDDQIAVMTPQRMAPMVPEDAGTQGYLMRRLEAYVRELAKRQGVSLTPNE